MSVTTRGQNQKGKDSKEKGAEPKKYASYDIEPKAFIEAWQTAESAEEVAKKLKMPKAIVHPRVSTYRSAGVKLKKMKRRANRKLNVAELNALIDHLAAVRAGATSSAAPAPVSPESAGDVGAVVSRVISQMRRPG